MAGVLRHRRSDAPGTLLNSLLQVGEYEPVPVVRDAAQDDARREEPARVWLHNDDVTPADYVVKVLERVFTLGWWKANWIMVKAHVTGQALVGLFPRKEAETRVAAVHQGARQDGWPLRLSIESP